jgi:type VI secretion system ImpM family protein
MLGLGKPKNRWNWAACGKHPVARDYFRLSLNTSLLAAFERWVEKGYQVLSSRQLSTQYMYSWRFWAKGIKKGNLICGVAKDSSDSIGRPYPLLIMGEGMLDGWEDHWDLLPHAFESTWDQIEYISSRRFENLKGLEHEVCAIKNPKSDWLEWSSNSRNQEKLQSLTNALTISKDNDEIRKTADCLAKEMECLVPLDSQTDKDPLDIAGHWNSLLKVNSSDVPNAVFLGGVPEKRFLAVFNRSLNASDFVRLWSAHTDVR